jgi:hypothetical protein
MDCAGHLAFCGTLIMVLPLRANYRSHCCGLPLLKLRMGANEIVHYRCSECQRLYVWNGHKFVACETPEDCLTRSRENPAPLRGAHR